VYMLLAPASCNICWFACQWAVLKASGRNNYAAVTSLLCNTGHGTTPM
jgi:hypothetical protein